MTNQISLSGASDVRPKLSALIQDLCPNGVEFKTLGEVCELKRGSGITESQAIEGDIPVIAGGQKPAYYHNQSNREGLNITVAGSGAYAGYVAFWEQPIFVSDAFTVSPKDTSLDIKFVYYFLKNIQPQIHNTKKGSGVPHVHPSSISDFEIPLPPLEIQKKMCLDKFSALAAELQAELQMRRKQYEYYRTHLLTPHSESNSAGDSTDDCNWEWKTLGELCDTFMGEFVHKNKQNPNGQYPVYNGGTTPTGYYDDYNATANKVIISARGAGAGFVNLVETNFWAGNSCHVIEIKDPNVLYWRFLYYFLKNIEDDLIGHQQKGGGVPAVSKKQIQDIRIAFPSLNEQKRIVETLDTFDKLTTSLSDGIPAEQAAQQKRYEYYRDLLLTFPRKAV